ncbi:DUF2798 domain-containing protein [Acinetobacter radioresistens]|uniref:DUF2798 domain-containing protein n=1 Tax=Acinetobacter radioresistens TaxID=40216 RepID=UPI00125F3B58|nr:DUF2798 domain-containing protein [Acinetobacter radioresistens]
MNQTRATIIGSIPKLPAACAAGIIPLILSCLMSGIISMINLLRSLGWVENFFHLWFCAWMLSWLAAFPAVLILLPLVRRIAGLLVDMTPPSPPQR